jgi:hypothetical protein
LATTPRPTNDDDERDNEANPTHVVLKKKQNDSFFNDILTKSDTLLAQTQQKMERLSRLETVAKPLAPAIPVPTAPPTPKPKPMATILTTTNTPDVASINNSKSLIDLKQQPQPQPQPSVQLVTAATSQNQNVEKNVSNNSSNSNQVDLLFDLNDHSFTLNTQPIEQTNSYFDLLGLDSNSETNNNTNSNNNENKQFSSSNVNILQSLFDFDSSSLETHHLHHEELAVMGGEDEINDCIQVNQTNEVLQQVRLICLQIHFMA